MKVYRTKISEMFFDKYGILHKTVVENCHVDLEALQESDRLTRKITENKKVYVLYDARPHFTLTEDAMEFAQKDIFNKQRLATAIVADKVGVRITADYMKNVLKTVIPIQIFQSKAEALKWLLEIKAKEEKPKKSSAPEI
jgi:hypothetical protein